MSGYDNRAHRKACQEPQKGALNRITREKRGQERRQAQRRQGLDTAPRHEPEIAPDVAAAIAASLPPRGRSGAR
jgi:hypothetical protein